MMETHLTHSGPMNPPSTQPASFEGWQALVAPGDVFRHPRELLAHPRLSRAEKRAILASWASDACALENAPGLRCLVGCRAEPVPVDAVLGALAELDRGSSRREAVTPATRRRPSQRRSGAPWNLRSSTRPGRRDDDDDPPPCPAALMPAPRPRTPPNAAARALGLPA
ncbi:hypothetical protein MPEAHAMD_0414 [Methylobacterium frigidaeris]|uniref:Uncharacterized protein n=2 Tax=Methylobacterium frigidaeris TaxID=2038277 RepID=A0AA37M1T9_9HYPH|nr:hypothetical protein MPEAHAMD_0414 [Methylobacterium frigidaeris]